MITCQRHHLQLRAMERGYTLAEVSPCIVRELANGFIVVDPKHPAYPKKGLGDLVTAGLKAVGITEERVKKVTGKKECGCAKRRAALNRLGRKITG